MILFAIAIGLDFTMNKKDLDGAWAIFRLIISKLLSSLLLCVAKKFMEKYYFSPYKVYYLPGFINLIIILIIIPIFIKLKEIHIQQYLDIFNICDFFAFIFRVLMRLFTVLIIQNYTICHLFLAYHFVYLYYLILDLRNPEKFDTRFMIISFSLFVVELFLILVFLEIIVLNCFGLDKYVKNNIIERSVEDTNNSNTEDLGYDQIEDDEYIFDLNNQKTLYTNTVKDIELNNF
jgi:hypothetical protein